MEDLYARILSIISRRSVTILLICGIISALGYVSIVTYGYIDDRRQNELSTNRRLTFERNNKIVKILPISTPKYTISYETNGDDPVTIIITCDIPYFRNQALQQLKEKDSEITLYHKIVFHDYVQPLKKKGGNQ